LAISANVDAALLALKPKNLSMREAAALPLVALTAWEGPGARWLQWSWSLGGTNCQGATLEASLGATRYYRHG